MPLDTKLPCQIHRFFIMKLSPLNCDSLQSRPHANSSASARQDNGRRTANISNAQIHTKHFFFSSQINTA